MEREEDEGEKTSSKTTSKEGKERNRRGEECTSVQLKKGPAQEYLFLFKNVSERSEYIF